MADTKYQWQQNIAVDKISLRYFVNIDILSTARRNSKHDRTVGATEQ
jgi:hypothetical protein